VLVTGADGKERVVEVNNDMGIGKKGVGAALKKQGVDGYDTAQDSYGADNSTPAQRSRDGIAAKAAAQNRGKLPSEPAHHSQLQSLHTIHSFRACTPFTASEPAHHSQLQSLHTILRQTPT
jgi:hypothetical protein